MKKIQLKKLELTNYRNIPFASYEFDGNSKIIGENRIGKTNTLEAIYWLLTDKLLDGSSDVAAIKPLSDTKLEVRVKATFVIDGKQITLEKDYKENWVKTRGTTNLEMKGHTTTCVYNDVKQPTLTAYNQLLCEDFGFTQDAKTKVDFMQMLVNPFYLGNLGESKDWTELRAFIVSLIGDVSDEDIAKANPNLSIITNELRTVGGRVDQLKKQYSGTINELETQITGDDSQIKLLEETANPTDDEVEVAKKGIQDHQDKITMLKGNDTIDVASNDIANKIRDKKLELSQLINDDLKKANENPVKTELSGKLNGLRLKQSELNMKKQDISFKIRTEDYNIKTIQRDISNRTNRRNDLIGKLKEIDSKIANPEVETECPHCHRPYEEKDLEAARENRKVAFEKEKAIIIDDGKKNKEAITKDENDLAEAKKRLESLNEDLKRIESEITSKGSEIEKVKADLELQSQAVEFKNPKIEPLQNEIAKLEEDYRKSRDDFAKGIQDKNQLIYDEEQAMQPFKEVLANRDYYERQMARLEDVKKNKTSHERALADVEQKKELLNTYNFTKLRMLDENVSKVFGKIKFALIKENINGGFDAICKPYIYDTFKEESTTTSWKSGSKSERVVTGIAIVESIKKVLGLPNLPFLFDEGGEISSDTFATRIKTDSQLICVKIADNIMNPIVQKI
ncbi:MAG: hypothetical protein J6T10_23140 [Methanobrevibacter sp.]|nr:hypothetical protein [Methanobrevibacter sp.]